MGRVVPSSGSGSYLTRATSVFSGTVEPRPLSFHFWMRVPSWGVDRNWMFINEENGGGPSMGVRLDSSNLIRFYGMTSGYKDTGDISSWVSTAAWFPVGVSWAADGTLKIYVGGTVRLTDNSSWAAIANPGASFLFAFGTGETNVEKDMAEFAAWNSELSGANFTSLAAGADPTTIGSVAKYVPIIGTASPEPETVGGSSWTIGGTLNQSAAPTHPTIGSSGPDAATLRAYRRSHLLMTE